MYKLAVLGDGASILGFRTLGFEVCAVASAEEARVHIARLAEESAVIYITEKLASELVNELHKYSERESPAIIPIPSKGENLGFGMRRVHSAVERAVGADILLNS